MRSIRGLPEKDGIAEIRSTEIELRVKPTVHNCV
jgi:hypothetical protein